MTPEAHAALLAAARELRRYLQQSTNAGPLTKYPRREAALLQALWSAIDVCDAPEPRWQHADGCPANYWDQDFKTPHGCTCAQNVAASISPASSAEKGLKVTLEWCEDAAQDEADAGDPDVTAGSEATFEAAVAAASAEKAEPVAYLLEYEIHGIECDEIVNSRAVAEAFRRERIAAGLDETRITPLVRAASAPSPQAPDQ